MALTIDINLQLNGGANANQQLNDVSNSVTQVGESANNASNQLANGVGGLSEQLRNMGKLAIGFFAFDKLKDYAVKAIELADAWSVLNSKMELATGSSDLAKAATGQLYEVAQKLRVPLADAGTLFTRLVPSMKEYGGSTAEAMRMTELLSMSLAISGATSAEAGSAMLQFSQAMSAGKMSGDEFNAVADAAPRFLQALAEGLGKPRGELKKLAEQGMLTTDQIYNALSKQLPTLESEFSKIPLTVGAAWTLLANAAMKGIGELDSAFKKLDSDYGITENLAHAIKAVADNLPAFTRGFVILAEAVAAYYLVMRGGPALMGAAAFAKDLLTAAMVRWQASAVTGTGIWTRLNNAFNNSPSAAQSAATGLGKLKLAGGVLAAAFIGWEIGTYLSDNFAWARNAGIMFISGMLKGWEQLKLGALVAWEGIKFGFESVGDFIKKAMAGTINFIASAAEKIGANGLADKLKGWSTGLQQSGTSAERFKNKVNDLTGATNKQLASIDLIIGEMLEESDTRGKVTTATNKQKEASDKLNKITKISAEDAKKLQTEFEKLTDSLSDQTASLTLTANGQTQLTDTQKLTAKATEFLTKMGDSLTESQRNQLQAFIQTLPQLEQQAVAAKKVADAQAEYTKKLDEGLTALQSRLEKAVEDRESMGKTESQVVALNVARDRETLGLLLNKQELQGHSAALDHEIDVVKNRIATGEQLEAQLKDNEGFKQQQEQIKENTAAWNAFADDIGKGFTDAFERMLETGKGFWSSFTDSLKNTFKKGLVDWLYSTFAKPFVMQIAMSASGSVDGTGGGLNSAMSLVNLMKGGFGGVAAKLGGSISSLGSMLGSSTLQQFGGGMTAGYGNGSLASGLGAKAGAALPWVAGIGAGILGGRAISGEYSLGGNKNTAVGIGTLIGAFTPLGPLGAAIGGAFGGVVNRAFGMGEKKTGAFGIEGNFSGNDFSGQNYSEWKQKGGWFRKDKNGTDRSTIDSGMDSAMDTGFFTLKQSLAGYATSLGLATNTITGYSKQIKLELTDDEAANTQKIADLFGSMADEMSAQLIPSMSQFSRAGETSSATLQRLAGVFDVTNAAASLLGGNMESAFTGIGLNSANARQALINFSGGLESFSEKVGFYYDNFYSNSEKTARGFAELDAKFDLLGLNVGLDKAAFRAEMDKVDVAADPARYAALLDIAPLFAQIVEAMGDSAIGKSIGVGVNATGVSEKQLAAINASADQWWTTYKPEIKAQTDHAAATTDAIVNLTHVSTESSEAIRAEIESGNAQLTQIINSIKASGKSSEWISRSIAYEISKASAMTATAVETAVASGQRN